MSAHDVTYNTGINTDDGVLITFSDLSLSWIDDEAPRLERISHRYEGVDQPTVRFGDRTVVVVEDLIDEDTATVDLWFAPNVGAVGDSNHLTTSWNAAFGGWVAPFDTADHLSGPGAISVSVRIVSASTCANAEQRLRLLEAEMSSSSRIEPSAAAAASGAPSWEARVSPSPSSASIAPPPP